MAGGVLPARAAAVRAAPRGGAAGGAAGHGALRAQRPLQPQHLHHQQRLEVAARTYQPGWSGETLALRTQKYEVKINVTLCACCSGDMSASPHRQVFLFLLFLQQCHDSCEAQAWSVASILEVLYDMEKLN